MRIYTVSSINQYFKIAVIGTVLFLLSFCIVVMFLSYITEKHEVAPVGNVPLSNDETYSATLDAIANMDKSPPCDTLARTMLAYASDTSLPQHVRNASVFKVMKKATRYCM